MLVTHDNINGLCKDAHPQQYPKKPDASSKDYSVKFVEWQQKIEEWLKIDEKLRRYEIETLVCDSGIKIDASLIQFYSGENRNATLLENGKVEISSLKTKLT